MHILHLSADFPDPFNPAKTRAVSNLIAEVPEHTHHIYSLNRVTALSGHAALSFGPTHRAVAYGAPPKGILLNNRLQALADWIIQDIRARAVTPDLIHAHKLTIEGLVAARIADALDRPLIVSSQGNTDLRLIQMRPDLRARWRRVWEKAAVVLPFAPWTRDALVQKLGARAGPVWCLPCPTRTDETLQPRIARPRILTVINVDELKNKNTAALIEAVGLMRADGTSVELDIAGGGSAQSFARLARLIDGTNGIRVLGPIRQDRMQSLMNRSALLAMPSHRESFGMVFSEALLAGCPVLHGRGNGICGYFPRAPWSIEAPSGGIDGLVKTLKVMLQSQQPIKAALANAQRSGELDILRRPAIIQTYRQAIAQATMPASVEAAKAA